MMGFLLQQSSCKQVLLHNYLPEVDGDDVFRNRRLNLILSHLLKFGSDDLVNMEI